jgi:sugar lactone lactonase YvrE
MADSADNRVLSWPNAPAFANAQPADLVLGQPDFYSTAANRGGLSATSLNSPSGVALDAQGNLYVADLINNRVLEYNAPLSSGMAASRVFGQPDFTHKDINHGGLGAASLFQPFAVALDTAGNLYVVDNSNSRVLEYDAPLATHDTADRVLGQPDFTHNTPNNGGLIAKSLNYPTGVALDAQGNLYVADSSNNRVLEYDAPLTTYATAARVFGQPDFTHNAANYSGLNADGLNAPLGVALDGWGNLYVADFHNNRVLEYYAPLTAGAAANLVFGQGGSFNTGTPNKGGVSAKSLGGPDSVALDAQSNLYVADSFNSRVLEYDWALFKLALPLMVR